MLIVHHLGVSQCERVLWLCEELRVEYKMVKHNRDPIMSPKSLKDVPGNDLGQSPFVEDTDQGVSFSESAACVEWIIAKHGNGRLALKPDDEHFADYLQWFHYSNGTLQPAMVDTMFLTVAGIQPDSQIGQLAHERLAVRFKYVDKQLEANKYLAGPEFTAADIMTMYSVTTQRYWGPQLDLSPYKNILRWLQDCTSRKAYQQAMEKGDPEMQPLTAAEAPGFGMFDVGGVTSDHWKKK